MDEITVTDCKQQFTNIIRAAQEKYKGKSPAELADRAAACAIIAKALDKLANDLKV